jgi:hypothetical protein
MPKQLEPENHQNNQDSSEQPTKRMKQGCFKCGSPDHRLSNCPILAATNQAQQDKSYNKKPQTIMTLSDSQQPQSNQQGNNRRPLSDVTCFRCNGKGHYSNSPDCPLRRKQQQ